jgi:predicted amidohydrolase YtcJ
LTLTTTFGCSSQQVADAVYTSGRIYTVNEAQPWAEAVAITDGKFVAVGSNAEVEAFVGSNTNVVDLEGRFVMPGIVDMHAHPWAAAEFNQVGLDLKNRTDPEAMVAEVKAYADANPELTSILGGDWNLGVFEMDSPDKKLLDAVVPDRPVYLISQSGHSAWVNSKALELAGFDENFQDSGAIILDRYAGTNIPSGTLRELAQKIVLAEMGFASPERVAPGLKEALVPYSRHGITAIQPAEGSPKWIQAAQILEKQGELNVRLFPAMDWITQMHRDQTDEQVEENIRNWEQYQSELVHPHYVKIFSDGGPDSRTCLLLEPYAGTEDFYGQMYIDIEQYEEGIPRLYSQGIGVHIHCIGDGSAEEIIRIFEEATKQYPESKANLHLSHCWMTIPESFKKLAAIPNATMDFSPMLAIPAPSLKTSFADPLGEERYQKFFNVKAAIETGMPVGFGSDFPSSLVPEPNMFWYMEGYVTRQFPDYPEYGTLNPSQAITVEQAIEGFTLGGAKSLGYGWDEKIGSIEIGKYADFVVTDHNPMNVPTDELSDILVEKTVFNGREVFDRTTAVNALEVVDIDITNESLDNAVDAANLNLLVEDELWNGGQGCLPSTRDAWPQAGAKSAPGDVNEAFARLEQQGYEYVRPARTVYWEREDTNYWIQWTVKDDAAVLWAYDPVDKEIVEVLQVREK